VTASLPQVQATLTSTYAEGRRLVLLFDYDGTLAPIVEHPHLATLGDGTRRLLRRLAGLPRVSVGIISGRGIDDLIGMVCVPGLYYGGTSGLELNFRGRRLVHPEAERGRALVRELAPLLSTVAGRYPGAWVERKPLGLTLHDRRVAPQLTRELRACALQALGPSAESWRVYEGPLGVEMMPALGWTKGSAVRKVLELVGAAVPLYAGDEANDTDALEAAADLGGVAIGIGPRAPSTARHRLPDPASLWEFLADVFRALAPVRASRGTAVESA
jgi:trehalose-phosphatase